MGSFNMFYTFSVLFLYFFFLSIATVLYHFSEYKSIYLEFVYISRPAQRKEGCFKTSLNQQRTSFV